MFQLNIGSSVINAPITTSAISIGGSALQYCAQGEPPPNPRRPSDAQTFASVLLPLVLIIGLFVVVYVKVNLNFGDWTFFYAAPTYTVIVQSPVPPPPTPTATTSTGTPKAEAPPPPQPKQGVSESSRRHSNPCDCGSSGLKNNNANTDPETLGTKNRTAP